MFLELWHCITLTCCCCLLWASPHSRDVDIKGPDTAVSSHLNLSSFSAAMRPGGRQAAAAAAATAAAAARVQELEAQVSTLSHALRSRAPTSSLAAVVAASRPTAEESSVIAALVAQAQSLQEALQSKVGVPKLVGVAKIVAFSAIVACSVETEVWTLRIAGSQVFEMVGQGCWFR